MVETLVKTKGQQDESPAKKGQTDLCYESYCSVLFTKKVSDPFLFLMDEMVGMVQAMHEAPRITYNKHHVAVGTVKRNFLWLRPRKRAGYCHFEIKVGRDNLDDVKARFEDGSISYNNRKDNVLAVAIQAKELTENKELIQGILETAIKEFA